MMTVFAQQALADCYAGACYTAVAIDKDTGKTMVKYNLSANEAKNERTRFCNTRKNCISHSGHEACIAVAYSPLYKHAAIAGYGALAGRGRAEKEAVKECNQSIPIELIKAGAQGDNRKSKLYPSDNGKCKLVGAACSDWQY